MLMLHLMLLICFLLRKHLLTDQTNPFIMLFCVSLKLMLCPKLFITAYTDVDFTFLGLMTSSLVVEQARLLHESRGAHITDIFLRAAAGDA